MPARGVPPVDAFCAIGPGGVIDLDMIRRSDSAARWAAGNVAGVPWSSLARQGWSIMLVRVSVRDEGVEGAAVEAPPPTLPPGRLRAAGVRTRRPFPAEAADRMKLLRLGSMR